MLTSRGPEPVRSALVDVACEDSAIRHGFFSRRGGVSKGIYRGLNVGLGSHDDPGHVRENRARVAGWFSLPADRLTTLHQVHSPDIHVATADNRTQRPKADGVVAREPGLAIAVLTADCGPVLFADPAARVIAACHAGWRGTLAGVVESTVAAMERLGAERHRIVACLGPSISQPNYEVGPELVERVLALDPANSRWFVPSERDGHALFDLRGMTLAKLEATGVQAEMIDACTYADEEMWYSYRRTIHRNEADYGRQISAIAMTEEENGASL